MHQTYVRECALMRKWINRSGLNKQIKIKEEKMLLLEPRLEQKKNEAALFFYHVEQN